MVNGQSVIIHGSTNQINANNVIVLGDSARVNHDNSWVINVSSKYLAQSTKPNQIIWMADKGISVNTSNASQLLVVDGDLVGTYFYGNGSQLTNVSTVDKYWLMYGYNMTINGYNLGIKTTTLRKNTVNLGAGLRLTNDTSKAPGTFSYVNGDLVAHTKTATKSLLVQDTNTTYNVSTEITKINNTLHLSTKNALVNYFLVFDGTKWVPSEKTLWHDKVDFISYSRPVSLWASQQYRGMLTLSHPTENQLVFSNQSKTSGLTIKVSGLEEKNQPISFGFNIKDINSKQVFTNANAAYSLQFDSLSGGYLVNKMPNEKLMEINRNGVVNFFNGDFKMGVNIPTTSRLNQLVIDKGNESSFAHVNYESAPFLSVNSAGRINFQSSASENINFRILPQSYASLVNQRRLQITEAAELILSDDPSLSKISGTYTPSPLVVVPDGDVIIDQDYYVGVFNASRQLQSGMSFHSDGVSFIAHPNFQNNVVLNAVGLGIRTTPNSLIDIKDPVASFVMLSSTSNRTLGSRMVFSKQMDPKWMVDYAVKNNKNTLEVKNNLNRTILQLNDAMNINVPMHQNKDLNINGDVSIFDSTLYLTNATNPHLPGSSLPFIKMTNSQMQVTPIDNSSGVGFHSSGGLQMTLNRGRVSIGVPDVPASPTQSLYVNTGSYISNRLYLNDEKIEYKTIRTPAIVHVHRKENTVQKLSFDYDTGFEILKPSENVVELSFQEHFSTINSIRADQAVSTNTQFIQPNGIDMMSFDGDYISVSANNITSVGDPSGQMDSLFFFNDLMNGGVINGDLEIKGTLNVFGLDDNNEIFKLYGDIFYMDMITFPWFHVVTENGQVVDHEYVITENVGIGTKTPIYPLEIVGVSSINIVESPSMNVSGIFESNKDYLSITAEKPNMVTTLNVSKQTVGPLLQFSNAQFQDHSFGLNQLNPNYSMTLHPSNGMFDSVFYIQGKQTSLVSFRNKFDMLANLNGDLQLKALTSVNDVMFISKQSSVFVSHENRVGINLLKPAKNSLDVSGNMVVGSGLAGRIQAPKNSVMVQNKLGIKTFSPLTTTDINGSMVVGESGDTYLGKITGLNNDLVIEKKLFVEGYDPSISENVYVNGSMAGVDALYFNKHSSNGPMNELSVFSPADHQISFGYGSSVSDRTLSIFTQDYARFTPTPSVYGLYFNATGYAALGHESPDALFHVKKGSIVFKVETVGSGDGYFKFEAGRSGLVGAVSNELNDLVLSDGENPLIAGNDISIAANGSVDIGYNVADMNPSGSVQASFDVKLDISGHLNGRNVLENGNIVTHMPEGSVIMWSGWTSELPEGWRFCTGVDTSTTTSRCNFVDYFVIGKASGVELNSKVGQHEFAAATATDYKHKHKSTHSHGNYTSASHNHDQKTYNTPARNGSFNSNHSWTPNSTTRGGQNGWSYRTWHWVREGKACSWGGCVYWGKKEPRDNWSPHARQTGYQLSNNGSHSHPVTVNHSHPVSTNRNNSHNHSLKSVEHNHDDTEHSHNLKIEPEYYKLAFIYLLGERSQ